MTPIKQGHRVSDLVYIVAHRRGLIEKVLKVKQLHEHIVRVSKRVKMPKKKKIKKKIKK